jgi:hypothetical protein
MKAQNWIDLSAQSIYLGSIRTADNVDRLALLDMDDRVPADKLRGIGFLPFEGSPRYERGIYYLSGEQALKPKQLAAVLGIERCPVVQILSSEIESVFRAKCFEKFNTNLNAVTLRAQPLGKNHSGRDVYQIPTGRFVRQSGAEVVTERSPEGAAAGRPFFLRASNEAELRQCVEGFLIPILEGKSRSWTDVVRFAKTVFAREVTDEELHRVQEGIESTATAVFSKLARRPDAASFALASALYYGLPVPRIRTSESVSLQQYSTPLPMAVVAQRLLIGHDDFRNKSVLEPTGGYAALLSLLPAGTKRCALELDRQRFAVLEADPQINAQLGDATDVAFRARFGEPDGFDYTIANPPFGSMEEPQRFDKLAYGRRIDHYIALRTLQARKDHGRSVFILAADRAQSDGTVEGRTKAFLAYLYDHYEVLGLVEVAGRLYARQGAAYSARLLVIGDRLAHPRKSTVPETLPILDDYADLWQWSSDVLQKYPQSAFVLEGDEGAATRPRPHSGARPSGPSELPTPSMPAAEPDRRPVPTTATASTPPPTAQAPWEMTQEEWNAARATLREPRPGERLLGAAHAQRVAAASELLFGVSEWYFERAKKGDEAARNWISEGTDTTHRDVVVKALEEQLDVPAHVLAAYADLAPPPPVERKVNEFQAPYQPASKAPMGTAAMVPINMAGATYAALRDLEAQHGPVDAFVARRLKYRESDILSGRYFDAAQIDSLALAIRAVDEGRGIINADQTGFGKGRFVAGMMRYAKLCGQTPMFLTIKPELFTDIFRDVDDIGSRDLFKRVFMFNEGVHIMRYGTEDEVLYRATPPPERRRAVELGAVEPDVDLILATYSQFQRAANINPKARLLTMLSQTQAMLLLDESHVAAGSSNTSRAVSEAVANAKGVVYSSATPLKGVTNFALYNKVFPKSVDLANLPETLLGGGEALQEAVSANMARDGVLVRREHDFSRLTFVTRMPKPEREAQNIELANQFARIVAAMSYLSGDVASMVNSRNSRYEKDWEGIPVEDRKGGRMRASSMNFGSRLYALNRQFLLGLKIDDCVEAALEALQAGRKPVIAVENTGEALLRQVLAKQAGVAEWEEQLLELDEQSGMADPEVLQRRQQLQAAVTGALRAIRLEKPPQYRELLEIMLERIGTIAEQDRYGKVTRRRVDSEKYLEAEAEVRALIAKFPDLPLAPLDVIVDELGQRGFPTAEVSGRTLSLEKLEDGWGATFHPKSDAVASVAGFQNGKYDAIIITRSGSTGISLHATDRFEDSDIRQRDFITLQKAANIAEYLQWLGRVNRKDQVCDPIITNLESGLPAEVRLSMMHNAKLRKLSANTTSNRENSNATGEDQDLLNEVGNSVAIAWLWENMDIAKYLDIELPNAEEEAAARMTQDTTHINKLLGRIMMVEVAKQEAILQSLSHRFSERLEELEQQGLNPFKVDVYDWRATVVKEDELHTGALQPTGSSFDEPVTIATMQYEEDIVPVRSERLLSMIRAGMQRYRADGPADRDGSINSYLEPLRKQAEQVLRAQLPVKFRALAGPVEAIADEHDLALVKLGHQKQQFLFQNLPCFKPGAAVVYGDLNEGELRGFVTAVHFPADPDEAYLLSRYGLEVVFPGESSIRKLSLATLFNQQRSLKALERRAIDPDKFAQHSYLRTQAEQSLKPFDEATDGKVMRHSNILRGNIFRACELAYTQHLGSPILYSDAQGNRQRAVRVKAWITAEQIKTLPVGMDAADIDGYVSEYLRSHHAREGEAEGPKLQVFDRAVRELRKGDGLMLEMIHRGSEFRLTIPGRKSVAGALISDGRIFDCGERTSSESLGLILSGTRDFMTAVVPRDELFELLRRLQSSNYVGKFYLADPKQDVLQDLKRRYEAERRERGIEASDLAIAV